MSLLRSACGLRKSGRHQWRLYLLFEQRKLLEESSKYKAFEAGWVWTQVIDLNSRCQEAMKPYEENLHLLKHES